MLLNCSYLLVARMPYLLASGTSVVILLLVGNALLHLKVCNMMTTNVPRPAASYSISIEMSGISLIIHSTGESSWATTSVLRDAESAISHSSETEKTLSQHFRSVSVV